MSKNNIKEIQVHCCICKTMTHHDVLSSHDASYSDEYDDIVVWKSAQILRCGGCKAFSFRHTHKCTEDYDLISGQLNVTEELYPNRVEDRLPIEGYYDFPEKTQRIYQETLTALNHKAFLLAAIGLRAIIESVCAEQRISEGSLKQRIERLGESHLSKTQVNFLHAHRFLGNAAAHEIVAPEKMEIVAALDIAETLLKIIYILPNIANQIKNPRKRGR